MIIKPAIILNSFEYVMNTLPNKDAVAPKIINTNEKPNEKKIDFNNTFFLLTANSFKFCPDM